MGASNVVRVSQIGFTMWLSRFLNVVGADLKVGPYDPVRAREAL